MKYSHGMPMSTDVNSAMERQLNDRMFVYFIRGRLPLRNSALNLSLGIHPLYTLASSALKVCIAGERCS